MLKAPDLRRLSRGEVTIDAFAYEAASETAAALGRAGRKLEAALAALERHDATPGANRDRDELVQEAADCAWALFIQRDFLGLKSDHHLAGTYRIPREVMVRVGIVGARR
ncbi:MULTISPECIES: DUF6665 family protein [unclassified Roseitalea]|uniref:DUF6665 family protein n=1 Tax=unclassified Roseitalea TaxID=2639107 RepID=UPI00273EE51F|nr:MULTISPECIES: DUF6665 family protein [unclassified Roseitalea]